MNSSRSLSFEDAVEVWLAHWAGQIQSRIAARFDVNQGRINEVLKERRHIGSRQAAASRRNAA